MSDVTDSPFIYTPPCFIILIALFLFLVRPLCAVRPDTVYESSKGSGVLGTAAKQTSKSERDISRSYFGVIVKWENCADFAALLP